MKTIEAVNARVDEQQWRVKQSLEKMVSSACASIADSLNRRMMELESHCEQWDRVKESVAALDSRLAAKEGDDMDRRELESASLWQSLVKTQDELSRQDGTMRQSVQDLWASLGELSCKMTDIHAGRDSEAGRRGGTQRC